MSVTLTSASPCECCCGGMRFENVTGSSSLITGALSADFKQGNLSGSVNISLSGTAGDGTAVISTDSPGPACGSIVSFNDPSLSSCAIPVVSGFVTAPPGHNDTTITGSVPDPITAPYGMEYNIEDVAALLGEWAFGISFPLLYAQLCIGGVAACQLFKNVQTQAVLTGTRPGGAENISYLVPHSIASGVPACGSGDILGGDGAFDFVACLISVPLSGLVAGGEYELLIPLCARPHGSKSAFFPIGSIVAAFIAPSKDYVARVPMGFPAGVNMDVKACCNPVNTLTRFA